MNNSVDEATITRFLEGKSPKEYIVAIEVPYGKNEAQLIINDPVRGKYIKKDSYSSFLWFKGDVTKILYGGSRGAIAAAAAKYEVKITKLKTSDANGNSPDRMINGYKYMAKVDGSYSKLLKFFKDGKVDVYGEDHKRLFMCFSPVEQYMISTGKRLFKGLDYYDDVHRLQFDLETTGLKPKGIYLTRGEVENIKLEMADPENTTEFAKLYEFDEDGIPLRHKDSEVFQIGIKDNRGFEQILEVIGDTKEQRREQEIFVILTFFDIINNIQPDIIVGYNSEFFDWTFLEVRCEILGINIEFAAKTLDPNNNERFKRVNKSIKLGGEQENYRQTMMFGYNIVDASHAVRRAKAINSDIKKWGLKYITEFSKLNKKNRVYVKGDKIHEIWADKETKYGFNDTDGDYYVLTEKNPLKDGYVEVMGNTIIRRYLSDDLWETEQVDGMYNQASYLLAKIIPTTYMRSSTMGTAGIWKLIMAAWSYENKLAIPELGVQQTFTGGLSRLLEVGFAKRVGKLDYAALYPNIELTWDVFPDVDISGAMRGLLLYIANTRDEFKNLKNVHKAISGNIKNKLDDTSLSFDESTIKLLKEEYAENSLLASIYDKKQLPIKILGNSFFGSLGAPNIFNWGDTNCAEETTCIGRQSLRLMVKFFTDRGFRALVMDTDGANFAIPDSVDKYRYTPKGTHRFTEESKGVEIEGLLAIVGEFNELFMIGRMGLDIDDICESTINFSRKNYGNLINSKVKLVGNTIKSSKMPIYIEEFLDKGVKHLLYGEGYEFIQLYNETVEKIYNCQIPLVKIASKANVKDTLSTYKADMLTKTKSGSFKARKAYMELLIANKVTPNLGSTIYYVNIGTTKSQGDCKVITDPETNERTVELNCKLISADQIENDPDLTTDEYNTAKYLAAFNKRIHPLLVCFSPEIRERILVDTVKNKKTKEIELTQFNVFTIKECELSSGVPFKDGDQDTLEELMIMEDKEIEFWRRVDKVPTFSAELNIDWVNIQIDYLERKRIEKLNGIKFEKTRVLEIIKRLEVKDIKKILATSVLSKELALYCEFSLNAEKTMLYLFSKKWGVNLFDMSVIVRYEQWANDRAIYYSTTTVKKEHTFEHWLRYVYNESLASGDTIKADKILKEMVLANVKIEPEPVKAVRKPRVKKEV